MFTIKNNEWDLVFVKPYSKELRRSDGSYTYGATDLNDFCIYISNSIHGKFLKKVLCHELCHAYIISNNIYLPIKIEEYICDAISDYGKEVLEICDDIYKNMESYYEG